MTFEGKSDGTVNELTKFIYSHTGEAYYMSNLVVSISSTNWGKALAGDYKSTITFTAEVVAK